MWFCPECYGQYLDTQPCGCESKPVKRVAFSSPGEFPIVCGHLVLLDDTPPPQHLLEQICDGPLVCSHDAATKLRCCSWRHQANTLWVWQGNLQNLPPVGAPPQKTGEASFASCLRRVMPSTGLLLIEAPQSTPIFLAHYARNQDKDLPPPSLSLIIDRLQSIFSLSAARGRAIALLDPATSTSKEDQSRLSLMSEVFEVFTDRSKALRWLLKHGMQPSQTFRATPRYQITETSAEPVVSNTLKLRKQTEANPLALVGLVDIGGTAGRQLLARIHRETYLAEIAARPRDETGLVNLPGSRRSLIRLRAGTAVKSLRYGHLQEELDGHVVPGCSIPQWTGERLRWWWLGAESLALALHEAYAPKKFHSLILGVGDSRFFGDRELASFLERYWQGSCRPAAIIRADTVDSDLLRWVRNEFSNTPEFPDSWDGGMRALDVAFRAAQRQLSE